MSNAVKSSTKSKKLTLTPKVALKMAPKATSVATSKPTKTAFLATIKGERILFDAVQGIPVPGSTPTDGTAPKIIAAKLGYRIVPRKSAKSDAVRSYVFTWRKERLTEKIK